MPSPLSQPSSLRSPGLTLVPPRPAPHRSPLALWHLLSLDAPTVAALWTVFLAASAGIALRWTQPAAMFVAVWMIYVADRLLDARLLDARLLDAHLLDAHQLDADTPTSALHSSTILHSSAALHSSAVPPGIEARHRFHHRHRSRFLPLIVAASFALVLLLQHIETRALHLYALLAALLAAWLLLIHAHPLPPTDLQRSPNDPQRSPNDPQRSPNDSQRSPGAPERLIPASHRLPKELAVGVFFPAAVFIPTVARAPWLRSALLPVALLFAAVCTLNCLFLYAWEHPKHLEHPKHPKHPEHPRQPSPQLQVHWTTRWAIAHLTQLATLVAAAASLLALVAAFAARPDSLHLTRWPALACALSAALLLLLHHQRRRFSAVHLRALADLVLLTPLLLLPFLRA